MDNTSTASRDDGPQDASAWDGRLERLEAFDAQAATAIDSLVSAVLGVQERLDQLAQAAPAPGTDDAGPLAARLRELETRVAQDAMARDIRAVSSMVPKRRIAVFMGRQFLCDNAKYTWLALTERARELDIECWFLPLSEETAAAVARLGGGHCFPASPAAWTAQHVRVALGAAVLVTDDHFLIGQPAIGAFLHGARHVQLWHGIGIKDVGFANLPALPNFGAHTARVLRSCGPFSTFVSTAACMEPEWRRSFAFERYSTAGYARNDVLLREPTARDLENVDTGMLARMREGRAAGRRMFLYAPTFRDGRRGDWIVQVDLGGIAQRIEAAGDRLVVNLHPNDQVRVPELRRLWPGVEFTEPHTDVYPLLREADALVTDYSSILFDYLLLDRPVIQFQHDLEHYTTQSRNLHDDKDTTLLGHVLHDAGKLVELLAGRALETGAQRDKRRELTERLHEHRDGRSAERLCELVAEEVARATRA